LRFDGNLGDFRRGIGIEGGDDHVKCLNLGAVLARDGSCKRQRGF
jgi:hypothetical protein